MIHIQNLKFSYENSSPYILDNINLFIPKASYLSILGENGSAKSTLVKLILGLLKPIEGTIKIDTAHIGYVPQKLDSFNSQFPITVKEVLKSHMKALKLKDSSIMDESLKKVSMENFKDSLIGNLSGGQIQKIFIARALMGSPELIVLDEPSTGIDIQSQREIYGLIKKLNLENEITVLSVEHNLAAALKNSTHIYEMESGNGKLYAIDEYKELIKRNDLER